FLVDNAPAQDAGVRPATHPTLVQADLPDLIPVETFFSTAQESWGHRVSPDGKKLLWIALADDRPTLHFRDLDGGEAISIPAERPVRWAYWAYDSRHITAWWDDDGDENYHFLLADTANPDQPLRDVTPHEGVKVRFKQYFHDRPLEYLLLDNRRDRSVFDLYWHNVKTGEERLIAENPGDIFSFYTDLSGEVIAVQRRLPDTTWSLDVKHGDDWRSIATGTAEDTLWIDGHPPAGSGWAWAISNLNRDRQVLVKLDLKTGEESVFYEDPDADVQGLWQDEVTYEPLFAWSQPDYLKVHIFDPAIGAVLEKFEGDGPFDFNFTGWNRDKTVLTLSVERDTRGAISYLVNQQTGEVTELAAPRIAAHADSLSETKPVRFKARDGLTLNGYLTIPNGSDGKNLPMVLAVHGGPFWRDSWGYSATDQFLANRGYAVLRVNYRGSTGYGKAFMRAAKREFAGKMHTDLIDGVDWAVEQGIADPEKVAIYGRSYGGYATLVGLTFTPEVFAAGVDIVGVADLATAFETFPAYWKNGLARWYLYVGRVENPEDRADMDARSPINFIDNITKPLLVVQGANDVRVVREHSDRIVAAMEEKGLEVEYIVFDDEGHSIRNWKNRMTLARAMERFLARHLGGRAELTD
ncbi:MAG: S9 family peptidase, partial [Pseudomonadota bacterium]